MAKGGFTRRGNSLHRPEVTIEPVQSLLDHLVSGRHVSGVEERAALVLVRSPQEAKSRQRQRGARNEASFQGSVGIRPFRFAVRENIAGALHAATRYGFALSSTRVLQGIYSTLLGDEALPDARFSIVDLDFQLGEDPDLSDDAYSRIELASGLRSGGPGSDEAGLAESPADKGRRWRPL